MLESMDNLVILLVKSRRKNKFCYEIYTTKTSHVESKLYIITIQELNVESSCRTSKIKGPRKPHHLRQGINMLMEYMGS